MDASGRIAVLDRDGGSLTILRPDGSRLAAETLPRGTRPLGFDILGETGLVLLRENPAALVFYRVGRDEITRSRVVPIRFPGENMSPLHIRTVPQDSGVYVSALHNSLQELLFRVDAQTGRASLVHRFPEPRTFTAHSATTGGGLRHERSNTFPVPFSQRIVWVPTSRGVVVGDGREYALSLLRGSGALAPLYSGESRRVVISDEEWNRWMTRIYGVPAGALARYPRPADKPAVNSLWIDGGERLWVQLPWAQGDKQVLYDVIDLSRRCQLARATLPAGDRLLSIRHDTVYTVRLGSTPLLRIYKHP